ncbi:hypothetical protein GQ53DRAFT_822312 [Thozetella sp. PMI_491]|nr:hypothetical protein GQ53DRAFT_822312 [Thozetella sp. PMI_491]
MSSFFFDPDTTPAAAPPPGVIPNLIDPPSIAYQPRVIICVFLPVMVLVLGLRIFTRVRTGFKFGADDYLCGLAAASVAAFCGIELSMLDRPNGIHLYDVPVSHIGDWYQRIVLMSLVMYSISAILVKSALLVLYLRIFKPLYTVCVIIWTGIAVVTVFYLTCMTLNLVQCVPRTSEPNAWLLSAQYCGTPTLLISCIQGVFSAVTDFFVLLIPVVLVSSLTLPWKKKLGVFCIFLTGLGACGCSLASCVYRFRQRVSTDFTYDSIQPVSFGVVELTVGVICSCLPVISVLVKTALGNPALLSFLKYLQDRVYPRSGGTEDRLQSHKSLEGQLPAVPQGRLTGLRSYIRRAYRTERSTQTDLENTQMSAVSDPNSVDYDYHAQLKKGISPSAASDGDNSRPR